MTTTTRDGYLVLPDRPEQATPGSRVGEALARRRRLSELLEPINAEHTRLKQQLAGYRATLAAAGPWSDMVEVAAARVGDEIVTRAIEILDADRRLPLLDGIDRAETMLQEAWRESLDARRELEAPGLYGGSRSAGRLVQDVLALVGDVPVTPTGARP